MSQVKRLARARAAFRRDLETDSRPEPEAPASKRSTMLAVCSGVKYISTLRAKDDVVGVRGEQERVGPDQVVLVQLHGVAQRGREPKIALFALEPALADIRRRFRSDHGEYSPCRAFSNESG